jgi:AraC-like DNA-binding protein
MAERPSDPSSSAGIGSPWKGEEPSVAAFGTKPPGSNGPGSGTLSLWVGGPIRLADIAATVHVSSSYLRHLFKRETGTSATHYVKLLRLRRAKELLETSSLSVKEVMSAVGFNDFSHTSFESTKLHLVELRIVTKLPSSRRARNFRQ